MAETHEREVLIRIRLEADKQRTQAAEKAVRDSVRGIQREATQGTQAASRKATDAVKAHQAAMQQQAKATQQMVAQQQAAMAGLGERFSTVAESAMRFGRGLAMLGASGEKDLQKLLEKLVKIQAAFDLTVGGFNALQRGSQLFNQLGQAFGMSGMMGQMNIGKAGVLAGGTAAWASVLPALMEQLGGDSRGGATQRYVSKYAGFTRMLGMENYSYSHIGELAESQKQLEQAGVRRTEHHERLGSLGSAMSRLYATRLQRIALTGQYGQGDIDTATTALSGARSRLAGLRRDRESGASIVTDTQLQGATAEYEAHLKRVLSLRQQEQNKVLETARKEVAAAEKKLSALQAGLSAQQQFGTLGIGEQQRIAAAAQRPMTSVRQAQDVLRFAAEGSELQRRAQQFLEQRGAGRFAPFAAGYGGGAGTLREQAATIKQSIESTRDEAKTTAETIGQSIKKQMEEGYRVMVNHILEVEKENMSLVQGVINQKFTDLKSQIQIRLNSEDAAG